MRSYVLSPCKFVSTATWRIGPQDDRKGLMVMVIVSRPLSRAMVPFQMAELYGLQMLVIHSPLMFRPGMILQVSPI